MSYQEENGAVVLRMSKEDYERMLWFLGIASAKIKESTSRKSQTIETFLLWLNRLNQGNPNYTPSQVKP